MEMKNEIGSQMLTWHASNSLISFFWFVERELELATIFW